MGMIECSRELIDNIPIESNAKSKVIIDKYFDEVPTLLQKDYEKWAPPLFSFKVFRNNKWYLGTFYRDGPNIGLSFSEFINK